MPDGLLRGGAGENEISDHVAGLWTNRSDRYSEERAELLRSGGGADLHSKVEMFRIGG